MKTIKTESLTQEQINYAVAVIQGYKPRVVSKWPEGTKFVYLDEFNSARYTTDWGQAGPLLDRFKITVGRGLDCYVATTNKYWWSTEDGGTEVHSTSNAEGGTYLTAAMRCLIVAKLGEAVEIPECLT